MWSDILTPLRRLCLDTGLEETVKWGQPCYVHANRNIAILGAFRAEVRLSFFDAALLKDEARLLERAGPNSQHADLIRFASVEDVEQHTSQLRDYISESMAHAAAGRSAPKAAPQFELPEQLLTALDADSKLADAFYALTPSRQRSYVIHITAAKGEDTRARRIEKAKPKILAGKGQLER